MKLESQDSNVIQFGNARLEKREKEIYFICKNESARKPRKMKKKIN